VRRQTPIRVSLNPGGIGWFQRFQGYIDQFKPTWPAGHDQHAEVSVVASGSLRRLGQGVAPLRSPLYRAISQSGAVAYWPLSGGHLLDSPIEGVNPLVVVAPDDIPGLIRQPKFAAVALTDGSEAGADLGGGARLLGSMPAGTSTTEWTVEWVTNPGNQNSASPLIVRMYYGASQEFLQVATLPPGYPGSGNGEIEVAAFLSPFVITTLVADAFTNIYDNVAHQIRLTATDSGGNVDVDLLVDGEVVNSGTYAGALGAITRISVNHTADAAQPQWGFGQLAVYDVVPAPSTWTAARGYPGETAGDRITRLCSEQGVPVSVSSTTGTTSMGPQTVATFLSLLRDCEAADGGILYDGESAGLTYLARQDRYNLAVSLALDGTSSQVKLPFLPIEDDQRVRNDITVRRPGGGSAQFTDPAHIAANGLYDTSVSLNVASDADLLDQAAWRVHL
jgi:hypothetical protein